MACLIKPPVDGTKGVLTLTTQERDRLVYGFADLRSLVQKVKQRYGIGLHHNWHDHALRYDDLFDFHLAGEEDLTERSGEHIPLLPMDACNFSPDCFHPATGEKFWDVLFVARAVAFKGIPEFFQAMRSLFDMGKRLRVLFICPVPPESGPGALTEVRTLYDGLFSPSEQELFTLLTTNFRYPFPFDLPTIAHFYRSSKIFAHSAPDERRCRVAAYAWAAGLPVVGMAPVGSVLSPGMRKEPYFFEIKEFSDFPHQILRALQAADEQHDFTPVQGEIASRLSVKLLEKHIARLFEEKQWQQPVPGGWMENLDIRMGRHHGLPAGNNKVDQDLAAFLSFLADADEASLERLKQAADPELAIAALRPLPPRALPEPREPVLGKLKARLIGVARRARSMA